MKTAALIPGCLNASSWQVWCEHTWAGMASGTSLWCCQSTRGWYDWHLGHPAYFPSVLLAWQGSQSCMHWWGEDGDAGVTLKWSLLDWAYCAATLPSQVCFRNEITTLSFPKCVCWSCFWSASINSDVMTLVMGFVSVAVSGFKSYFKMRRRQNQWRKVTWLWFHSRARFTSCCIWKLIFCSLDPIADSLPVPWQGVLRGHNFHRKMFRRFSERYSCTFHTFQLQVYAS